MRDRPTVIIWVALIKIEFELYCKELEYSSPNYPNDYTDYLNVVETVTLQGSSNSGFVIEIVDFQIEDRLYYASLHNQLSDQNFCYDYLQIEPLTTIDGTDVSTLEASVENFYNTQICGEIGSYTLNGLPTFQSGDTIKLPNVSSFNIRFRTDINTVRRGFKIKVYESTDNLEESVCINAADDCSNDTCLVDLHYVNQIVSFYADNQDTFNPTEISQDGACVSTPSFGLKRCEGEAPNLMIVNENGEGRSLRKDYSVVNDQVREKGLIFFAEKEYVGYDVSPIVTPIPKEDENVRTQRKF